MCGIWARGSQARIAGGCLAWESQDVQPKALGPGCHPHKIALPPPASCCLFVGYHFLLDCLSSEQMDWWTRGGFLWGEGRKLERMKYTLEGVKLFRTSSPVSPVQDCESQGRTWMGKGKDWSQNGFLKI